MAPGRSRSRTRETRKRKKSESSDSESSGSGSSRSSSQSSSSSGSSGSSSSSDSRSRSASRSASRSRSRTRSRTRSRSRSRSRSGSSSSSSSRSAASGGDKRKSPARHRKSPPSPPKGSKIHVGRLTKNVTKDHILEIFSMYGPIRSADLPPDRIHPHLSRGFAYVDFEKAEDAEKSIKYMDGGQIDGQEITVSLVYAQKPRSYGGPMIRRGGGGGGGPNWGRRSMPRRNRRYSRSPPRYRRSRTRSRTPPRKRRGSSSRSSSR